MRYLKHKKNQTKKVIYKLIKDTRGMELIQVMSLLAISLVVGGILMTSTNKELGTSVNDLGNSMASTYDFIEFDTEKEGEEYGSSAPKANDAYNLNGLPPEYYAKKDETILVYEHSKNGTIHNLTGEGTNIKFTATEDWNGNDSLKINGKAAHVYSPSSERLEKYRLFSTNAIVTMKIVYNNGIYYCYM